MTSTFLPSFPANTHSNILCAMQWFTKCSWDSELAHKFKPFKHLECHFLCLVHLSCGFAIICLFYPHRIMNCLNFSIFRAYLQGWYIVSSKTVVFDQGQFCFPWNVSTFGHCCHNWGKATGLYSVEARVLLNILQCTRQSPIINIC